MNRTIEIDCVTHSKCTANVPQAPYKKEKKKEKPVQRGTWTTSAKSDLMTATSHAKCPTIITRQWRAYVHFRLSKIQVRHCLLFSFLILNRWTSEEGWRMTSSWSICTALLLLQRNIAGYWLLDTGYSWLTGLQYRTELRKCIDVRREWG